MRKRLVSTLNEAKSNALENITKKKYLVMQEVGNGSTLVINNKIDYKLIRKAYSLILKKIEKLKYDHKTLNFINLRSNSTISLNLYFKNSVSPRKNVTVFIQQDQVQEYFTAAPSCSIITLYIVVPPFVPFNLLLLHQQTI